MHKVFAAIRAWHRPRQHHSLFARWWRDFVILLPTWPLMHLFFSGPWYEGIGSLVGYSFIYARGEYGYFHVHGGTFTWSVGGWKVDRKLGATNRPVSDILLFIV